MSCNMNKTTTIIVYVEVCSKSCLDWQPSIYCNVVSLTRILAYITLKNTLKLVPNCWNNTASFYLKNDTLVDERCLNSKFRSMASHGDAIIFLLMWPRRGGLEHLDSNGVLSLKEALKSFLAATPAWNCSRFLGILEHENVKDQHQLVLVAVIK